MNNKAIKHRSEKEFIDNFFTHDNWEYEPRKFQLTRTTYTPDFYDMRRDVYIEVSGCRGSYYKNRHKYKEFRELYPNLKLEVRLRDGSLFDERGWKSVNSERVVFTVKISAVLHECLRKAAYEQRRSMADIMRELIEAYLSRENEGN